MNEIIKKLRFKSTGTVINAPDSFLNEFTKLGFVTSIESSKTSNETLVFVNTKVEFVDFLTNHFDKIEPDSVLWFAYPKGTSGIKTDINRDILRVTSEEFGITTVSAISIDDTWSALRFRPIDKVGKK